MNVEEAVFPFRSRRRRCRCRHHHHYNKEIIVENASNNISAME